MRVIWRVTDVEEEGEEEREKEEKDGEEGEGEGEKEEESGVEVAWCEAPTADRLSEAQA